jgi:hypothetical protein
MVCLRPDAYATRCLARSSAKRACSENASFEMVRKSKVTNILWIAVFVQVAMGGFDTFYHHEMMERLAWRPSQNELRLHGVRNLAYAVMFVSSVGVNE